MESDAVRISKFKGAENWCVWRFQLRVMLLSHDVFDVINGKLLKLTPPQPLGASPTADQTAAYNTSKEEYDKELKVFTKMEHCPKIYRDVNIKTTYDAYIYLQICKRNVG